jgi:hypothetical protein
VQNEIILDEFSKKQILISENTEIIKFNVRFSFGVITNVKFILKFKDIDSQQIYSYEIEFPYLIEVHNFDKIKNKKFLIFF